MSFFFGRILMNKFGRSKFPINSNGLSIFKIFCISSLTFDDAVAVSVRIGTFTHSLIISSFV